MPRLTSCPKLIITSGTYLHATRTLPGSTYIPNSRGSLITHVKFQLPSADATFLDVMAGFDMCGIYILLVRYLTGTVPVLFPLRIDGAIGTCRSYYYDDYYYLYTCTFHRMMR